MIICLSLIYVCVLNFQSRVTTLASGDRNFHIFYQLLTGADIHLLSKLNIIKYIVE